MIDLVSPEHHKKNLESWTDLQSLVDTFPSDVHWTAWKVLAKKFLDECISLGLNGYFRAGQSMHHLVFSTLDQHGLRDEPRVTVDLHPETQLRIAFGRGNIHFASPELEYLLPYDTGFPTFRRFMNQLWTATMPEAIPGDLRGPIAPLSVPILRSNDGLIP